MAKNTPVIPMLDPIIHTAENGYTCSDPTCPCQNLPWDDDEPYEPYYSRADELADQATADYYDEQQRRNSTRQCTDGSWW